MKAHHKIYLGLLFALAIPVLLNAKPISKKETWICGQSDSAVSVEITSLSGEYPAQNKNAFTYTVILKDNRFSIRIAPLKGICYLNIRLIRSNGAKRILANNILEAGDSVYITESNNEIAFSGRSAIKFQTVYEIAKIRPVPKFIDLSKPIDMYEKLQKTRSLLDSLCKIKLSILDANRDKLTKNAYEILQADCIGQKRYAGYAGADFYLVLTIKDSIEQQQIKRFYADSLLKKDVFEPAYHAILNSRLYTDYLYARSKLDCRIRLINNKIPPDTFSPLNNTLYHEIRKNYSGLIRGNLLTTFFLRLRSVDDSLSKYLANTIAQTKQPTLIDQLTMVQRQIKGSKVFNFSFPDSSGKMIRLSDFRGKTVLLDIWYTGCSSCVVFAKSIRPVIEKKDSNVVFITLSIDKREEMWKESIRHGLYTSEKEINLYTGGHGINTPFVQYYRIHGYPYVMIITPGGKLSSINPDALFSVEKRVQTIQNAIGLAAKER